VSLAGWRAQRLDRHRGTAGSPAGLAADAALPTQVPTGTALVIADQADTSSRAARVRELARAAVPAEFANFVGGPAILEAFRAGRPTWPGVGDTPPNPRAGGRRGRADIFARRIGRRAPARVTRAARSGTRRPAWRQDRLTRRATAQQVTVLRALEKAGLRHHDVQLVRLQLDDFNDAVRTGQVDVAPLNEPRLTRSWPRPRPGRRVIDPAGDGGYLQA